MNLGDIESVKDEVKSEKSEVIDLEKPETPKRDIPETSLPDQEDKLSHHSLASNSLHIKP